MDSMAVPAGPSEQIIPTITWGKHRGKPLSQIPLSYMKWLATGCKHTSMRQAAMAELQRRGYAAMEALKEYAAQNPPRLPRTTANAPEDLPV